MIKYYCDACEKQIQEKVFDFEPLVHIVGGKLSNYVSIEDGKMLPTSGRKEHYDLCNSCYNKIYSKAYEEFLRIKSTV